MSQRRIVVYLIVTLVAIHLYMHSTLSLKPAYYKIQPGSTSTDVLQILGQYDIICGEIQPPGKGLSGITSHRCDFQDPWRKYLIVIDPQTGRVVSKRIWDKGPGTSHAALLRILRWVRSG